MKTSRLYRITRAGADNVDLVRATNREQALRYVAKSMLSASLATDDDIYEAGIKGALILDATKEAA